LKGELGTIRYCLDCGETKQQEVDKKARNLLDELMENRKIKRKDNNQFTSYDRKRIKEIEQELD
jgi:hypothetical protein